MLPWSFTKFLFLDGLSASNSYLVPTHLLSRFEVRVKMSVDKYKYVTSIQKTHPSYFWTFRIQPDSSPWSTQLHIAWHHHPLLPQVPEISSSRFILLPLAYSCPRYNLAILPEDPATTWQPSLVPYFCLSSNESSFEGTVAHSVVPLWLPRDTVGSVRAGRVSSFVSCSLLIPSCCPGAWHSRR